MSRPKMRLTKYALAALVAALAVLLFLRTRDGTPPVDDRIMPPEAFTALFLADLRDADPSLKVTVSGPLALTVELEDDPFVIFLDNTYQLYSKDPDRRAPIVSTFLAHTLEALAFGRINPGLVLPVVKPASWLDDIRNQVRDYGKDGKPNPVDLIYDDWFGGMIIVYAENRPLNVRYMYTRYLDEIGVPRNEIKALALSNLLTEVHDNLRIKTNYRGGPVHRIISNDPVWNASLLLLDSLWSSDRLPAEDRIVVAVPLRNLLLFADAADPDAVAALRREAEEAFATNPYSVTPKLFVRRGGAWRYYEE